MHAVPMPRVETFFHAASSTFSYVVFDEGGGSCAIVDAVLDFDMSTGRTSTRAADEIVGFVRRLGLKVEWLLETHVHADHLSAAHHIQQETGGIIAMGRGLLQAQAAFRQIADTSSETRAGRTAFGHLFEPDEQFNVGRLWVRAMHVPGHTPADVAYAVGVEEDAPLMVFVGDTLFMPDVGTARCDFPGGHASTLFHSVRRLLSLPGSTRLFMCHDYPPPGRPHRFETTVQAQRESNIHLHDGISEAQFVEMRQRRDHALSKPALMLPALQVNFRAGELPAPHVNGVRYLSIPLNAF